MDKLSIRTVPQVDGQFLVEWRWNRGGPVSILGGDFRVSVDPCHTTDRAALAELRAIYHLLEVRNLHNGAKRLGRGVRISVSSGAIRKSLAKGAIKQTNKGRSEKAVVAQAAGFLATKYFEAEIEVGRWPGDVPREVEPRLELVQGPVFERPKLQCALLDEEISISSHAMHRQVGRIDQKRDRYTDSDLTDVTDARWSAAWHWFDKVLAGERLIKGELLPKVKNYFEGRYGRDCVYLVFQDSIVGAVLVVRRDSRGLVVATVLRISPYQPVVKLDDYVVGQRLVQAHKHLASKK